MSDLRQQIVADAKIDDAEVALIRERVHEDGRLDLDDVAFLVELYCSKTEKCPAFDDVFFSVLKKALLSDDQVFLSEHFYLMKMLYSDHHIRPRELQLLREIKREAKQTSPEFDVLCDEAENAHPTDWSVGGRPSV